MKIVKSEYGWTALHSSGRAIAHSKDRAVLDNYVRSCGGERQRQEEDLKDLL